MNSFNFALVLARSSSLTGGSSGWETLFFFAGVLKLQKEALIRYFQPRAIHSRWSL
jgi:hypothetical protein